VGTRRVKKDVEPTQTTQDATGKRRRLKTPQKAGPIGQPLLHELECLCGENIPVFSVLLPNEEGEFENFQPSCVQCPECGLYHRVVEVCESMVSKRLPFGERLWIFDESEMPEALAAALDSYEVDQARKAYMTWCLKHGKFDAQITLFSEVQPDGQIRGRTCSFTPEGKIRVSPFLTRMVVMPELDED
jgi:hypothetical protein